jgi:von Willebrand factor type A domain
VRTLPWTLALWALWILGTGNALAQEPDLGEVREPVQAMQATTPKNLLLILDVSGSMKKDRMLARTREAIYTLLTEGVQKGDRVALYTFGAGYKKVFDTTIKAESDKKALFAQVPIQPEDGAGTNIRKPHHEALKLAESVEPASSFLVLLTDSFNDEPKTDDPARGEYLKYYIPGGRLDKYPKTPENADYERLLKKYREKTYGVGIGIDGNGRPEERLPKDAPTPAPMVETSPPPVPTSASGGGPPLAAILGGLAALGLGVGAYFFLLNPKPMPLRIALASGGGAKDFHLKGNVGVRLGGDGAAASFDAYPLAGVKESVGKLTGARGQLLLTPTAQPNASARVFINGMPLEKPTPVRYGDEIRVSVEGKELRLKLIDPAKSF